MSRTVAAVMSLSRLSRRESLRKNELGILEIKNTNIQTTSTNSFSGQMGRMNNYEEQAQECQAEILPECSIGEEKCEF